MKMRKKKKNNNNDDERDKISGLPDSILHHIFSFLNMEEAVRSSVFSKRWRHLWTSLPTLNFEYGYDILDDEIERSNRFIDKLFILREGSNIQKFSLICQNLTSTGYFDDTSRYVDDWIISALRCNVEELVIQTNFDNLLLPFLPNCLFDSKSLTILNLSSTGGSFLNFTNTPDSMCLPNLKTLILHSTQFVDDDETSRFFSSCPVLESLTIEDGLIHRTNLRISSLSLKHLVIEASESWEEYGPINGSITLCTPNLISFHCKDYFMEKNFALENLSSLVKAYIYSPEYNKLLLSHPLEVKKAMYAQPMLKFLGAFHNVTELRLPAPILEVVSGPALLESNPIYRNLRSLKMDAPLSEDCIHTIICLLQMSPAIETLYINFNSPRIEESREVGLSSECLLNHLKRVEIRKAKGSVNELKFLETLLKNAVVLETLMIVFASTEVSVTDRETRFVKFGENLRAFPKASSSITIMLI